MAEQDQNKELSDEEKMKQMMAKMQEAEYKGLTEAEIEERKQQKEMRRKKNIQILEDTLTILEKGSYIKDAKEVQLQFSPEEMRKIQVYLPDDIQALQAEAAKAAEKEAENTAHEAAEKEAENTAHEAGGTEKTETGCIFGCENTDSLFLARKRHESIQRKNASLPEVLVLNLASSTHPGGRVRDGAGAQEEDLCRKTSLLLSLESEEAKRYYDLNSARKTRMGSDGVLISPYVEVIKDASNGTLSDPFPISVMSCSAPMIRMGLEGMTQEEYETMLYKRMQGMLTVAASLNYRHLILGAFGCGVFGNDAALVSDLFHRAIQEFSYEGRNSSQLFDSVEFAVLCRSDQDYNFKEFSRNFSAVTQ